MKSFHRKLYWQVRFLNIPHRLHAATQALIGFGLRTSTYTFVLLYAALFATALLSGCASRPNRTDLYPEYKDTAFSVPHTDYQDAYEDVKRQVLKCWVKDPLFKAAMVMDAEVYEDENRALITLTEVHRKHNEQVVKIELSPYGRNSTLVDVSQLRWDFGITDVRSWLMIADRGCI